MIPTTSMPNSHNKETNNMLALYLQAYNRCLTIKNLQSFQQLMQIKQQVLYYFKEIWSL